MRCEAQTKAGGKCSRAALKGTKRCTFHTPGRAAQLGQRGGLRRRIFKPEDIQHFEPPKDAKDLMLMLAVTLVETREMKIEPRVANAFFCGCGMFLHALELVDVAAELKELKGKFQLRFGGNEYGVRQT